MTAASISYQASHIERVRSTKAEVESRRAALCCLTEQAAPATVRQIFYLATVAGLVPKTENGYDMVQTDLALMRRDGTVPPDWLRLIVREAIERHLPAAQFEILKAAEASEQQLINGIVGMLNTQEGGR